jgi:SNF2 family DNA or RNA helicase
MVLFVLKKLSEFGYLLRLLCVYNFVSCLLFVFYRTRETLATGNLLSVINVLMQLRKVCNHPNLFEVRPTISPFQMEGIAYVTASLVMSLLDYDPFKVSDT